MLKKGKLTNLLILINAYVIVDRFSIVYIFKVEFFLGIRKLTFFC